MFPAPLLDRLAVVLVAVDVDLVEQDDLVEPALQLALDDPRAHVLGLVGGLLLEHPRLGVADVLGDLVFADVAGLRRGGDVQRHVLGEGDEVGVGGHEVGVAVDLDEHADLAVGVDVALDGALAGLAPGELADLAAHLHAQDLGRAIEVALGLLQRRLAVHHPRAGLLAQRGDVLGADLDLVGHAFCSWVSGAGSVWASASAVVVWLSASTSLAGGEAGSGVWSVAGGAGCATSAWRSSESASWSTAAS